MQRKKVAAALLASLILLLVTASPAEEMVDLANHETHTWEAVLQTEPTCGEAGYTLLRCAECQEELYRREAHATGDHQMDENGMCVVCGYADMSALNAQEALEKYGYFLVDQDASGTYSTGDTVLFGSYPQTLVSGGDAVLPFLQAQEALSDGWVSYGYYSGGEAGDYMLYKDVAVEGRRFRGVQMTAYRPYYTGLEAGGDASYIDDSGFELDKVYWFEYTPILWNVLEYRDGHLFLNAKYCLDAQPFQDLYEGNRSKMVIPGTDILVNDWEACSVRAFLNGLWRETAFSDTERGMLQTVSLNNRTTGYAPNAKFQITQHDTEDQVFLLSYEDVMNPDYGYPERSSFDLEANGDNINEVQQAMVRRRSYTDYAAIQGCRPSTQGVTAEDEPACYYMLRSAGSVKFSISGVSKYGSASYSGSINPTSKSSQDGLAFNGDFGLLPAIYVKVGK